MNGTLKDSLFCCLIFVALFACGKADTAKKAPVPPLPEQAIEKFSVRETEAGKPHWVLEAESAQIRESKKRIYLQSPRVRFYQEGRPTSDLVAEKGQINTDNYDIWGEGKCTLDTVKGEKLITSNLYYKSETKKIMTDDAVTLIRPDEVIRGKGMEATPDLENITIRNQRVELNK